MNATASWSRLKMTMSLYSNGELQNPCLEWNSPGDFVQSSLPSKSKQKIENRVSSCWKATQTRLPSVTGVELAKLFRPCFISLGVVMTTFSQRRAPSFALRQRSFRSPLFSRHVVTKIRSPQTTGDEWPL